jgi:hypothetical protein
MNTRNDLEAIGGRSGRPVLTAAQAIRLNGPAVIITNEYRWR